MDELGTDLRGIRMCEFVEDGQGLMPGLVCGGGVAIAVVDVAEAGEGHSFEVAVAEFAPQCDRTLVIGDGLIGVAVVVGGRWPRRCGGRLRGRDRGLDIHRQNGPVHGRLRIDHRISQPELTRSTLTRC
jgi:hypothetical protein